MSVVLVVDDNPSMLEQYAYDLHRYGHHVVTASRGEDALEILQRESVDCVVLDLELPGLDGFQVLTEMQSRSLRVPVIVYTGTGSYERCVRAIKLGAFGFIDKDEKMERVVQEIENAAERGRLISEVNTLKTRIGEESRMVGQSRAMETLRNEIERVAPIPSPVLILGESGSGKELVAREIHERSGRAKGSFIAINCAAMPESLVESELFGHEAGAFTGAQRVRKGAFEAASGGTLLLDELGELPLSVQSKLLRVLEEHNVTRVGGTRTIAVDTRVIAATNRDLEAEVAAGRFRPDLYFRINVHPITVPPLRERLSDVPLLVEHFLTVIGQRFGIRRKGITPEALNALAAYTWRRNNIRELRNIVERMIIASDGPMIDIDDIPAGMRGGKPQDGVANAGSEKTMRKLKSDAEREILLAALERNGWQITKTAAELGLADHSSLLKAMRRHGIKRQS
jgi:two-component system, NtrC family, nitrogen regulation response regulator NtrX